MVNLSSDGYASQADLAAWITPETVPANWASLLRSASLLVAQACNRNPYTDTPAAGDAAALRDAVCAQAASWITLGVDPAKAGTDLPGPVKSSTVLDATVVRDTTAATRLLEQAADGLAPETEAILSATGLLWVPVPLTDPAPYLPSYGLSAGPAWRGPYLAEGVCGVDWPFR